MIAFPALVLYSYLRTRFRRRFRTRAELLAWQAGQVARHLARVVPRSPFYREYFAGRPYAAWADLPPLTKAELMARFDDWNTAGVTQAEAFETARRAEASRDFAPTVRGVTVGLSSGTSGHRGLFLVSPAERALWAGAILARALPEPLWRPQRVAFFLRANSNLYASIQARHIQFRYFDLLCPMEEHLAELNAFQPTYLVAPPSVLRALAEAGPRFQPRRVIAVAEVLDPVDEAVIQRGFGQITHQIYQATEGFLGCTCRHGVLHLMEDIAAIRRAPLTPQELGAPGKFSPIITDFHRFTQPVINYQLDDILTERAAPCPCGSPLTALAGIAGRCDDIFIFPKPGGGWARAYPDFIRRAILLSSPLITAYRARQIDPAHLEIHYTAPAGRATEIEAGIEAELAALCRQLGGQRPAVAFAPLAAAAPGPRKLKRVERLFAWPEVS